MHFDEIRTKAIRLFQEKKSEEAFSVYSHFVCLNELNNKNSFNPTKEIKTEFEKIFKNIHYSKFSNSLSKSMDQAKKILDDPRSEYEENVLAISILNTYLCNLYATRIIGLERGRSLFEKLYIHTVELYKGNSLVISNVEDQVRKVNVNYIKIEELFGSHRFKRLLQI